MTFATPDICPIVELSKTAETTIDSVATNVCPADCTESVTEFSMGAAYDPEMDITPIFSHGSTHRYRLSHDGEGSCPCECLGRFGCPTARYVAQDGELTIVFHAADYEELQDIVAELRERFPNMDIERFIRSPAGEHSRDSVLVDRSKLTARQLEVLETAHEMGYFDRPRQANANDVAAELDINPSTFSEHLSAAETKIFGDLL
ncbi:putative DNA binding protein [Halococcus thailandensis JCM 13552]|uniref:Putative DNA binding protein n=1 Tax=Halococcus thailandensis JCM 13552 TaxID=1227457 RepID=M0NHI6_9EURY|nr:putative DNA binding protein [Halococcus thailandensis JCM 13552]